MMSFVFHRVKNIVGKGEKCWSPAFTPFPTMFSKGFLFRVVITLDCVKVLEHEAVVIALLSLCVVSVQKSFYTPAVLALFVLLPILSFVTNIFCFSATMHHSDFKLGMVLRLGVPHVAVQVVLLSTSCFTT